MVEAAMLAFLGVMVLILSGVCAGLGYCAYSQVMWWRELRTEVLPEILKHIREQGQSLVDLDDREWKRHEADPDNPESSPPLCGQTPPAP